MKKVLCRLLLSLSLIAFGGIFLYYTFSSFIFVGQETILPLVVMIPIVLAAGALPIYSGVLLLVSIIKKEDE